MGKRTRIIAISPTPECLCLAAACRDEWDALVIAGRYQISAALEKIAGTPLDRLILLQPRVDEPETVREILLRLVRKGTARICWFAPTGAASVEQACADVPGVDLVQAPSLDLALKQRLQLGALCPDFRHPETPNPDLEDFLRYKISLCFMRVMDPAPLVEAVDAVCAAATGRTFRLANLSAADRASVEHFREADFPYLEGQSAQILHLKRRMRLVAPTDLSALILGETGTGKEYVAFYMHEFSPRRAKPLVALNCAGLEENLLRSELFGHCKGAFTGAVSPKRGLVESAEGGTLFLDEIGEMPLSIQADLLRFLQTRRFRPVGGTEEKRADIRIIAATQPNLSAKIRKAEFRSDLYYRIAEVVLHTPALREVPEDIWRVVRHVVHRHERFFSTDQDRDAALAYFEAGREILERYSWPGNARELISMVRRRLLLLDDVVSEIRDATGRTTTADFGPDQEIGGAFGGGAETAAAVQSLDAVATGYVRAVFARREALGLTQKELAARLGIAVNTLKKYLEN